MKKEQLKNANLNRKRNILNQIIKDYSMQNSKRSYSKNQYFQSFSYTDHITNNIFNLDSDVSRVNINNNALNDSSSIVGCYNLMKQTRKFHLSSIKQKNYRMAENINEKMKNLDNLQKEKYQKYVIRKKKQRQKYIQDKLQLKNIIYQGKQYLYKSANVSLLTSPRSKQQQSFVQFDLKKQITQNINQNSQEQIQKQNRKIQNQTIKIIKVDATQQIIKQFQKSVQQQKERKKKKFGNKKSSQLFINYQDFTIQQLQLIEKLNRQLRRQIKKNGEYLVQPSNSKLNILEKQRKKYKKFGQKQNNQSVDKQQMTQGFFRRPRLKNIIKTNQRQKQNHQNLEQKQQTENSFQNTKKQISNYSFKFQDENQIIDRYKLSNNYQLVQSKTFRMNNQQKNMIQYIKQGNYFGVQINLSMNSQLLKIKQPSTSNNLLHLCIKYNRPQIFVMIVRKCVQSRVDLLNEKNKFNKTPKQLRSINKAFFELSQGNLKQLQ